MPVGGGGNGAGMLPFETGGCGAVSAPESGGGGGMSDGGKGAGVPLPGGAGGVVGEFPVQPNAKNIRAATKRMAANIESFMSFPP